MELCSKPLAPNEAPSRTAAAILAPAAPPPVLAEAATTALLALGAPPPVLADGAAATILAPLAHPPVLALAWRCCAAARACTPPSLQPSSSSPSPPLQPAPTTPPGGTSWPVASCSASRSRGPGRRLTAPRQVGHRAPQGPPGSPSFVRIFFATGYFSAREVSRDPRVAHITKSGCGISFEVRKVHRLLHPDVRTQNRKIRFWGGGLISRRAKGHFSHISDLTDS
jgi:hypothetical protein